MRKTLTFRICLCLLIGWAYSVASHPLTPSQSKGKKEDPKAEAKDTSKASTSSVSEKSDTLGPIGVFADIEEAWQKEKVQEILRHFGDGKVAISIEGIGPTGGTFSKSQSHYLLKDLFKYTITKEFEFVQYRNVSDGRAKVYAVAVRSYKRNDDGRLFEDKIYVSLQLEDDRWVISEIKSIR